MTDLLERVRREIEARRDELRPLLTEYEQLLEAVAALEPASDEPRPSARQPASRDATRARAEKPGKAAGAARGRPLAASTPRRASRRAVASTRKPRSAAQSAILAALEHGSHSVSELVVVTAMTAPSVRQGVRRLVVSQAVTRAKRDGKAAYALARSVQG